MADHPTCTDCARTANDWVPVLRNDRTVLWEPDLKEVRPRVWKCWPCRRELHQDMPDEYVSFNDSAQ